MTGVRIVHAADIHLDSPLRGLGGFAKEDVAHQLRQASRQALKNLVRLTVDEKAAALVLAGDIYDGDWPDYATGRFFAEQMDFLNDHGVRVFMAAGNHDAASVVTKAVRLPDNVTVLDVDKAETVIEQNLGLAVHGQGFATRAVTKNLALAYPDRVHDLVNVGILHTAVSGAEGHDTYAPCDPSDLLKPKYEYFALGHVHQRQVVNDGQWVAAFSGNLQGRHANETGPKGALVVDLDRDEPANLRFVALDVARWERIEVDASGHGTLDEVLDAVETSLTDARVAAEGRPLVTRVTVTGTTRAAGVLSDRERLVEEVRASGVRTGVIVEKAVSHARMPRAGDRADDRLIEAVLRRAEDLGYDSPLVDRLTAPLKREFGRVLRKDSPLDLNDPVVLERITAAAMNGLVAKMTTGEDR